MHEVGEKESTSRSDSSDDEFTLECIKYRQGNLSVKHFRKVDPYTAKIKVNGKNFVFEIDTEFGLTVINEKIYRET